MNVSYSTQIGYGVEVDDSLITKDNLVNLVKRFPRLMAEHSRFKGVLDKAGIVFATATIEDLKNAFCDDGDYWFYDLAKQCLEYALSEKLGLEKIPPMFKVHSDDNWNQEFVVLEGNFVPWYMTEVYKGLDRKTVDDVFHEVFGILYGNNGKPENPQFLAFDYEW